MYIYVYDSILLVIHFIKLRCNIGLLEKLLFTNQVYYNLKLLLCSVSILSDDEG